MKSSFEKNSGTYRQVGDFKIPNLTLTPEETTIKLGKWGLLHKDYLFNHKKVLFTTLLTQGKLYQHCAEVDHQAKKMYDLLIEQMKKAECVTEQLKDENQMEWVCRIQNIEARVREYIFQTIVYV